MLNPGSKYLIRRYMPLTDLQVIFLKTITLGNSTFLQVKSLGYLDVFLVNTNAITDISNLGDEIRISSLSQFTNEEKLDE